MDGFFARLRTIHHPDTTHPWLEAEYGDFSDFRHFLHFVNDLDNIAPLRPQYHPVFFRGQSDASWTLKPKLVRLLEGIPLEKALQYEFDSVRYFRERAHLFCASQAPAEEDFLEWLCLMQHFSAPTRLLDWTTSFTVALYFAVCENPLDVPGAVWILPGDPLWEWMRHKYPDSEIRDEGKRCGVFADCDSFVAFGVNRAQPRLDGYDPDRKSERVVAQRGIFTICDRLSVDHAVLIGEGLLQGSIRGENWPLFKIVISREAKRFFRQYLSKLNITAATLFPGIDGLGRTIAETLRVHRENLSEK